MPYSFRRKKSFVISKRPPPPPPPLPPVPETLGIGTGRRSISVARVYVRKGNGKITVNGKELTTYFPQSELVSMVRQPLKVTANENKFEILINVYGGGYNGQAGACRHGLARALCQVDHTNYSSLRSNGFLAHDSRMVERKKIKRAEKRRHH